MARLKSITLTIAALLLTTIAFAQAPAQIHANTRISLSGNVLECPKVDLSPTASIACFTTERTLDRVMRSVDLDMMIAGLITLKDWGREEDGDWLAGYVRTRDGMLTVVRVSSIGNVRLVILLTDHVN